MKFRVFKSSIDGICGGEEAMSLKRVLSEVSFCRGYDSVKEMHAAITRWAHTAKLGTHFKTHASAIVAVGPIASPEEVDECPHCHGEHLSYGDLSPVEEGNIEQTVKCGDCGESWQDVFVHAERRTLAGNRR